MFTARPYPENPNIQLLWDGPNTATGTPAGIEMVGDRVYVEAGTVVDAEGNEELLLLPEERTALLLMGAGLDETTAQGRLEGWFDDPEGSVISMQTKLGAAGLLAGEAAIALGYEQEVLIPDGNILPDQPATLNAIRPENRWNFLQVIRLLGANQPFTDVCTALRMSAAQVLATVDSAAEDLGLEQLQRPSHALMLLAGNSGMLPKYAGVTSLHDLLLPRNTDLGQFFPPDPTKSIWDAPFEDDPYTQIRYSGQHLSQIEPSVHVGGIDRLLICNAVVDVHNPVIDTETGERLFTSRELAMFVFKSLGMSTKATTAKASLKGKENGGPLWAAYAKLFPGDEREDGTARSAERGIRAAFQRGIYKRRRSPTLDALTDTQRERFARIGDGAAEGRTNSEIADDMGLRFGAASATASGIRFRLNLRSTAAYVLVAEADNPAYPLVPLDRGDAGGPA